MTKVEEIQFSYTISLGNPTENGIGIIGKQSRRDSLRKRAVGFARVRTRFYQLDTEHVRRNVHRVHRARRSRRRNGSPPSSATRRVDYAFRNRLDHFICRVNALEYVKDISYRREMRYCRYPITCRAVRGRPVYYDERSRTRSP